MENENEKDFGDLIAKKTDVGLDIVSKDDNELLCFFDIEGMRGLADFINENRKA